MIGVSQIWEVKGVINRTGIMPIKVFLAVQIRRNQIAHYTFVMLPGPVLQGLWIRCNPLTVIFFGSTNPFELYGSLAIARILLNKHASY